MKKYAEDLATAYNFKTKEQYFEYIVDTLINEQREQVRDLFNQMHPSSQLDFLNTFLKDDRGIETSTRKICIYELLR